MDWSVLDYKYKLVLKGLLEKEVFGYDDDNNVVFNDIQLSYINDLKILNSCVCSFLLSKQSVDSIHKVEYIKRIKDLDHAREFDRLESKYSGNQEGMGVVMHLLLESKLNIKEMKTYSGFEYLYIDYILYLFEDVRNIYNEIPASLEEYLLLHSCLPKYYVFEDSIVDSISSEEKEEIAAIKQTESEWIQYFTILYNDEECENPDRFNTYIQALYNTKDKTKIKYIIQDKLKTLIYTKQSLLSNRNG